MDNVYIDIREYFENEGQILPTKKGISLNTNVWEKLKSSIDEIDGAIVKIK